MYELWGELDSAVIQAPNLLDTLGQPWESTDPRVAAAWEALTRPENLASLEAWYASGDYGRAMNDYAAGATREAIKVCRSRAG